MLSALGVTFFATMIVGVPIAFCLGLAGLVAMLVWGKTSLILIPQRMFTGVDSFVLMAVPLFMLAGELMGTSGIITRLVRFADVLVGWIRGGLAHVNIVSAMILSGVCLFVGLAYVYVGAGQYVRCVNGGAVQGVCEAKPTATQSPQG